MSAMTWTQYVAMDEPAFEPRMFESLANGGGNWDDDADDDFQLGQGWDGGELGDLDDPE